MLVGLSAWFAYVGLMTSLGVVRNTTMRPPGIAFIIGPVLIFIVAFSFSAARSSAGARVAPALPLWLLLSGQAFRIGIELFLHQLWVGGLVPRMLTFAGANGNVYTGASAPPAAWLSTRGRSGMGLPFLWNVSGLVALTNVVVRSVLTAPGPLNLVHAEVPNRMMSTFPYTFVPGFFVPLAVALHVLAMRAIRAGCTCSYRPHFA